MFIKLQFPGILCVLVFIGLSSFSTFAQSGSIKGRVIDSKTLEPLPFANVFLNNTTIGTVSDVNGDFLLKNIGQAGAYELVISFVGYKSTLLKLEFGKGDVDKGSIKLVPSEVELNSVEVKGTRDKEWERKIKKFKKIFLGDDKAAAESVMVNPWVIDFPEVKNSNKFLANATGPIEIDNNALGYKIFFYLSSFEADSKGYSIYGHARFNDIQTVDEAQRLKWENNRRLSYLRSRHHLFKAIIDHRIRGEGFYLYTDKSNSENANVRSPYFNFELTQAVIPFDTVSLATRVGQTGVYRIALKGRVEVHYHKERALIRTYRDIAYPVSWIQAERDFILVNKEGYELNPADVAVSGAMSADRVARMLPIDYKPNLIPTITEEINLSHFQENIYVHTDKPYYYPGEALWFKGYINYGTPLWRDSLSRTVYVELINPKDEIIKSKILKIDSGLFQNDFILPDTLTAGAYYLRAYTNFNRNFGDSLLYAKPIPVLHITDKVNLNPEQTSEDEENAITITSDKVKYKPREKITINLGVKDEDGNPMSSHLSVSVTDATQVVPVTTLSTILEGFLLKEIQAKSDKYTINHPIEYGINFRAQLFNSKNKPWKETFLNVIQINPRNLIITQSNGNGLFAVNNLDFYGTTEFRVQSISDKDKVLGRIDLKNREIPSMNFTHPKYQLSTISTETPQRIISEYEVPEGDRLLQEVIVTGQKIIEEKDVRTYGKPDYVLNAKDINSAYGNLLLTLPGKIQGLLIREVNNPNGIETVVYINRLGTADRKPKDMLVMIDDVAIGGKTADILAAIDPMTIETIEVKTGISGTAVLHGSRGAFGVISIYTKKDVSKDDERIKNFRIIKVEGYSLPRPFKSPEYNRVETDSTKADYRSTLYWNPNINADSKTGKAIFSFFASDLSGRYRIVVEGVTQNNQPIRSEDYITIENE